MTGDRSGEREKDVVRGRPTPGDERGEVDDAESIRSLSGERVSDISPTGVCAEGRGGENGLGDGLRGEGSRGEEL